jgi:hypothetical protein
VDVSQFLQLFPEFGDTDRVLVQSKLTQAAIRMGGPDTGVWGSLSAGSGNALTQADLAQGNLAAHYLITSPFGTAQRLDPDKGKSTYYEAYEEIELASCSGFIVSGGAWPATAPSATTPAPQFSPGVGTVTLTNGSTAITFASPQTIPAGTLFSFSSQPGAYYSLALSMVGVTAGTLAAPYTGTTTSTATWTHSP